MTKPGRYQGTGGPLAWACIGGGQTPRVSSWWKPKLSTHLCHEGAVRPLLLLPATLWHMDSWTHGLWRMDDSWWGSGDNTGLWVWDLGQQLQLGGALVSPFKVGNTKAKA